MKKEKAEEERSGQIDENSPRAQQGTVCFYCVNCSSIYRESIGLMQKCFPMFSRNKVHVVISIWLEQW